MPYDLHLRRCSFYGVKYNSCNYSFFTGPTRFTKMFFLCHLPNEQFVSGRNGEGARREDVFRGF